MKAGMSDLMREYERARFPLSRRLDLHAEGPRVARNRALHWIQSRAHEAPGEELLLIVDRGGRRRSPSPVEITVRKLLDELEGRLIEWWQPFAPGSLAVRVALEPKMLLPPEPPPEPVNDGRTEETSGAALPPPEMDIPAEFMGTLSRAAELRIDREGLTVRLLDVVLREVWIEAQAMAMEDRITFEDAVDEVLLQEIGRLQAGGG